MKSIGGSVICLFFSLLAATFFACHASPLDIYQPPADPDSADNPAEEGDGDPEAAEADADPVELESPDPDDDPEFTDGDEGDSDAESENDGPDSETPCTDSQTCDEFQYCFIMAGESSGFCQPYCDMIGVNCPVGYACEYGFCAEIEGFCRSHADCDIEQYCEIPEGWDTGRCAEFCTLPGVFCSGGTRCEHDPQSPDYGRCLPVDPDCTFCHSDSDCPSETLFRYCDRLLGENSGCCRFDCRPGGACPDGRNCGAEGRCCQPSCDPLYSCDWGIDKCTCTCRSGCASCPPGYYCDASTAPECRPCPNADCCENPIVCGVLLPPCCRGYECTAQIYGVLGYCI